jgi:[ribosomal protein S18]-alanine N-acetyltransferase
VLEKMRRRDIKQILPIERQVYPKPWTAGVFQSEIEGARSGERYYVVARIEGELVGYAGMLYAPDEAHVTNIAVDPARQRRGIGRHLLVNLARTARRSGSKHLSLEVRVSNHAAQELYRRFGFVPAGVRPRYYENTEDALVMWCHDIDRPEYAERLEELDR